MKIARMAVAGLMLLGLGACSGGATGSSSTGFLPQTQSLTTTPQVSRIKPMDVTGGGPQAASRPAPAKPLCADCGP